MEAITHRYLHGPMTDQILAEERPSTALASTTAVGTYTVTPNIKSDEVAYFGGTSQNFAAGEYVIGYAGGALIYNDPQPMGVHGVQGSNEGFFVRYKGLHEQQQPVTTETLAAGRHSANWLPVPSVRALIPRADQDAAERVNAGSYLRIHHEGGGPIGLRCRSIHRRVQYDVGRRR